MPVTALYAALLAPLLILLSVRVIRLRRSERVAIGDGGDASLLRAMRVHANFSEYVPLALVLMGLAESLATAPLLLHALGATLVAGRLSHAYGVSKAKETLAFRVAGMAMTFATIGTLAALCFFGSLSRLTA